MNKPFKLPATSLRTAILAGIAFMALMVIAVMSLIQVYGIPSMGYTGHLQQEQEKAFNQLQYSADLEAGYLQRVINEKAQDARSLTMRQSVRLATAEMNAFIQNQRESEQNSSAWPDMNFMPTTMTALNDELLKFVQNYDLIVSVDIIEPKEHIVIASSNRSHVGKKNVGLTEVNYDFSPTRGRYAALRSEQGAMQLVMAQKIFMLGEVSKAVRVTGIVLLVVDIDAMVSRYSQKQTKKATSETLLVDSAGFAITALRHKDAAPLSYKIEALPAQLAAQGNEGIIATVDYRGEPVMAAFRHIRLSTSLGMGMVLKRDQTEVFAPVYGALYNDIIFMILAFLILIGMTGILVRRLTDPLKELDTAVQQVEAGDLSVRGIISGSTEIRRFTSTLNAMVEKVEGWHGELNRQVTERTVELEEKNAELEQFSYTVSHDLKSPLVTIKGFVGMLEKDAKDGNQKRMSGDIKRINEAAGIMATLLDELLEFSRVGRLNNPHEEIPMFDLVNDTVELLSGRILEGKVKVDIQSDLPTAFGDRPRIREAIQNLIENAVKFMGEQPAPHIEVGSDNRNGEVVYYVRDNGVGIDKAYLEKVFGMFERLNTEVAGTGMGLALVKRIVETHGGRIWVESDGLGSGCTFYFTLPQKEVELDNMQGTT